VNSQEQINERPPSAQVCGCKGNDLFAISNGFWNKYSIIYSLFNSFLRIKLLVSFLKDSTCKCIEPYLKTALVLFKSVFYGIKFVDSYSSSAINDQKLSFTTVIQVVKLVDFLVSSYYCHIKTLR